MHEMPDEAPFEEIGEKAEFIHAVQEGIAQAERDEGITLEEWNKIFLQ